MKKSLISLIISFSFLLGQWQSTDLTSGKVFDLAEMSDGTILAYKSDGILYKSVDDGVNWTATSLTGLVNTSWGDNSEIIAVSSSDRVFIVDITGSESIIYYSDDLTTWNQSDIGNTSYSIKSIAVNPSNGDVYASVKESYQCTDCGIFRSTDDGLTFSNVYENTNEQNANYKNWAFASDGTVFVTSDSYSDEALLKSSDGINWTAVGSGLTTSSGYINPASLIITSTGRIIVSSRNFNDIGSGNYQSLYASDDGGTSWSTLGDGTGSNLVAQFWAGMVSDAGSAVYGFKYFSGSYNRDLGFESSDDGVSWTAIDETGYTEDLDHDPVCSHISSSQYIYVCTENSGVYRTVDVMQDLVYGCTDDSACNYSASANSDDGSCSTNDSCGVCGGDGTTCCNNSCSGSTPNCNGFGSCYCSAGLDVCGVCGGDGTTCCNNSCSGSTPDCDGAGACVCSDATGIDECGVCGGNGVSAACSCTITSGLNADGCCDAVVIGCDNTCGSGLVDDVCGDCNGNGVAEACSCTDTSGLNADDCCDSVVMGCDNNCGSGLVDDECGACGDNGVAEACVCTDTSG